MSTKKKSQRRIEGKHTTVVKNIISCILVLYTFISIYLIGMTVLNSFKTKSELINNTMGFPKAVTLDNFLQVIVEDEFLRYLLNSVILVVASVFLPVPGILHAQLCACPLPIKGKALLENYFLLESSCFPYSLEFCPCSLCLQRCI